jgi:type IV pilus assembly protein PilE
MGKSKESVMKHIASKKGFTLVELMIAVGIVAILVALALPSYTQYIRKANRGEAQQLLMNWANNQEIWRASNPGYADDSDIALPGHDKYDFSFTVSATTFTLTATANTTGDQDDDKEAGKSCTPLTLNQSNTKEPQYDVSGTLTTFCW